jgi:serine/threonine protein kinase
MAVTSSIPRGTLLSGKYKVGRELGRGGMAAVYRAVNVDIDKNVAIKLLAGHLSTSSTVVERFLREARAVSKIKSPHICDVFDSGRLEDGTPFLVMELLEGESLYDAMCRDRQMSPELTLSIILQVSRGLSKAHEQNIVHRDLKPENIFLTVNEDGNLLVKILDFGLAKFYDPIESAKGKGGKHARLTREGAVFGTPAYMSPEQVRGQAAADTRADLWALACITYECVTGTTVWSTEDGVAMTFAQIATAPLPDPRSYRPDLPDAFTEWFKRALDRNIEARFQTVRAFADGLAAAFDYRSSGGGLDSRLVEQITHVATGDPNGVTQRRSNRPKPPSKPKTPVPPPARRSARRRPRRCRCRSTRASRPRCRRPASPSASSPRRSSAPWRWWACSPCASTTASSPRRWWPSASAICRRW